MKKFLLIGIPMSVCNFRCHYCYLSHRPVYLQGEQPRMRYTPEEVARALSPQRLGGTCLMNFCADGETLLTRDLDLYIRPQVEAGHFVEIVTNLTPAPMLERILSWDRELLGRVAFKCSFHYLQLKEHGLLERFAEHVRKIWDAGASASIELLPSDELIPYIDEVKAFSLKHFQALPQLTIARDDRTAGREYLTKLSPEEYDRIWSGFDSPFWAFKKTLFGVRRKEFCYAGAWSVHINLATGSCRQCYCGMVLGNAFAHPEKPFPSFPIGGCRDAHCYNGHALLSAGLIPQLDTPGYGDLRDRVRPDGSHWLQPEMRRMMNGKLIDSNARLGPLAQRAVRLLYHPLRIGKKLYFKLFDKEVL